MIIILKKDVYLPVDYAKHGDMSMFEWKKEGDVVRLPKEFINKLPKECFNFLNEKENKK